MWVALFTLIQLSLVNIGIWLCLTFCSRFFTPEDCKHSSWLELVPFLKSHLGYPHEPVSTYQHTHVKKPLMLSGACRIMWRSLFELVYCNKLRGYDIVKTLSEDNQKVSRIYGTVALIDLKKLIHLMGQSHLWDTKQ